MKKYLVFSLLGLCLGIGVEIPRLLHAPSALAGGSATFSGVAPSHYMWTVTSALAGVSCTLPFNLTNGTLADATQVMANYNALVACLGNAASAGVNSDITALTGLTTPLAPGNGGSSTFSGVASGGNTIVLASTTPSNYTLTANNKVRFVAAASNVAASTGTTLQVGATPVKNFYRQTPSGPQPMVGGEIVTGQTVEAIYDGTQYQMTSIAALAAPPGALFEVAGGVCPAGSLEANGAGNIAIANYPTLSGILGTTWGPVTGGSQFTIPDLRGRTTFSRDSGGSARITVAGGNFDGTVIGNTGGQQSKVVGQTNLASFDFSYTDPGHTHNYNVTSFPGGTTLAAGANFNGAQTATATSSAGVGITVHSGGGAVPLPTLANAAIIIKCIKG